jgi:hypothetical protein
LRDLNCSKAYTSCRGVDENLFPRLELRQLHQPVPGGKERAGDTGSLHKAHVLRLAHHEFLRHQHPSANHSRVKRSRDREDRIARAETRDAISYARYFTGALAAKTRSRQRFVDPHSAQDIPEVESGCLDGDLYLSSARRFAPNRP